jgi:hypothetical protein
MTRPGAAVASESIGQKREEPTDEISAIPNEHLRTSPRETLSRLFLSLEAH